MKEKDLIETSVGDSYLTDKVSKLNLDNQCGAVVSLECYVKEKRDSNPVRRGNTGNYELGQNRTLNLADLEIAEGSFVTAFANVVLGTDCNSGIWVEYSGSTDRTAYYTISGVIGRTKVALNGIS